MALPSKRHTSSQKRVRRGALKLKILTTSTCGHCKKSIKPHTVCHYCGYYKGRAVLKIKIKKGKQKKEEKKK